MDGRPFSGTSRIPWHVLCEPSPSLLCNSLGSHMRACRPVSALGVGCMSNVQDL